MATQNKKKILDSGFGFYKTESKKLNRKKKNRRNSHIKHTIIRKSQIRATYNSMFYGY